MPIRIPCVLVAIATMLTSNAQDLALRYTQPASEWLEALPLGNGSLGGMVFGSPVDSRIQFNKDSLWLGDQTKMGGYQAFGDLYAKWNHAGATDYHRELDISDAVHRVSYVHNGVKYSREAFCSFPGKVMAIRFTADKPGSYTGVIHLTDAHKARTSVEGNTLQVVGRLSNAMDYEAQVWVLADGGQAAASGEGIAVTRANSVTLLLAAGTSFANDPAENWRGEHPHERVTARLEAASQKPFEQLRQTHVDDYRTLFSRVSFQLDGPSSDAPADVRVREFKSTGDVGLEALLFQYGRYLLISSSRPGGLPANLQGIWNANNRPPWFSGYTANINLEMNYWPAEVTALPECHEPLFQWVQNMAVVYRETEDERLKPAKGRGWSTYTTLNPFGGATGWAVHLPQSAWMMQHFWWHYAFTQDKKFLREVAYPAMKEIVGFWEDRLIEGPEGKLITPDGWSPEHGPVEKDGKIILKEGERTPHPGVTYDQEIVMNLFNNYIQASETLGVDAAYRAKVAAMRDRLLGPKIGSWGQIQEWMEDVDDPKSGHRHVSHLFALYPGREIDPMTTPELAKAAAVSLKARANSSTGWSKAWKINLWARLHDGEKAYKLIRSLIIANIAPNLFSVKPFQIDANFGYTAGVAEMLLQSQIREQGEPVLQLLPALPAAWPTGSVTGLRARGGFAVDMSWENGNLTTATIHSPDGGACRVRYGDQIRKAKIPARGKYVWKAD